MLRINGLKKIALLNTRYQLKKKELRVIRMVIKVIIETCQVILTRARKKYLDKKLLEFGITINLKIYSVIF